MKRLIYLLYYLKEMDWQKFNIFLEFVSEKNRRSKPVLLKNALLDSLLYNISPMEYFQFHFFEKTKTEKEKFAGTGTMYEYQLVMNPKSNRYILEDKAQFLIAYKDFVRHNFYSTQSNLSLADLDNIIKKTGDKIVIKNTKGQCGRGVEVLSTRGLTAQNLLSKMEETGNDLAEEFVRQHAQLQKLSPSGLNTIRIITQLNERDEVELLGCRLRITINSAVDNMAAGNIAAPIDEDTGIVNGPGVYSDITKTEEEIHPVTKVEIVGFQVPFWKECLQMVKDAALLHPENRSIGWDVAITDEGPELIEGNHDWCKLLWQLPVKKGLKPVLDKYKSTYLNSKK